MESPTFTVPSTDTYYDRFTGVGVRHTAGDVVTQRRAWLLQMAGATEPVNPGGLVAEITEPHDGDALAYDADAGVWINRRWTNLIGNGDFETDVAGWNNAFSDATLSRETGSPIRGTGSLKIVAFEPGAGGAAHYPAPPTDEIAIDEGAVLLCQASFVADGAWQATLYFDSGDELVRWAVGGACDDPIRAAATVVAPAGTSSFRLRLESCFDLAGADPADTLIVDDVCVAAIGTVS